MTHKYLSFIMSVFPAMPILFTSCVTTIYEPYEIPEFRQKENIYYVPSAHHAPLLQQKNDFSSSVMMSLTQEQIVGEFQAAYVATRHLGFTLNYSKLLEGKKLLHSNRFEVGTGYILPFSDNWLFETYGGWGTGKIKNLHQTGLSNIKSNHFFLQPAIAVSNKKKTTQFAFVSKFSRVHFTDIDTSFDTAREPFSTNQVNSLQQYPFQVFWEPGLIFRFGWDHFLFHTSFTVSKDISNTNLSQAKSNFSLGMTFRFSPGSKGLAAASAASLPRIE